VLYRVDKLGSILIAFFSPIQFCNDLPDMCHYTDYNTKIRIVFFSQSTKIGIHEFKNDFTEGRRGHIRDRMIV
jgi:NRPS condensation-like uncharacterized protein